MTCAQLELQLGFNFLFFIAATSRQGNTLCPGLRGVSILDSSVCAPLISTPPGIKVCARAFGAWLFFMHNSPDRLGPHAGDLQEAQAGVAGFA